ncbi:MAG: hypothetical protein IJB79_04065 [Candidatus Gastranaerophilales bacterium]|nr:hypothetical protein [Candidatus Gastranaerophilales bacterium]
MGWVTLTLRKTELKKSHSDYQKELLDISRRKRQMAREYHYEQLLFNNDYKEERDSLYTNYKATSDALRDQISQETSNPSLTDPNGNPKVDQNKIDDLNRQINEEKENYERLNMMAQEERDEELQRLENEANDEETMLDQEQVEIEAQLEAISAEIEAVGEAISSQIQASTIKLS